MVDPNHPQHNPVQALLLQRFNQLQPPDIQALAAAGPAVLSALKRIFPEVGFLFDALMKRGQSGGGGQPQPGQPPDGGGMPPGGGDGGAPGGAPGGGMPPGGGGGGMPPGGDGGPVQRPTTRLGGMN